MMKKFKYVRGFRALIFLFGLTIICAAEAKAQEMYTILRSSDHLCDPSSGEYVFYVTACFQTPGGDEMNSYAQLDDTLRSWAKLTSAYSEEAMELGHYFIDDTDYTKEECPIRIHNYITERIRPGTIYEIHNVGGLRTHVLRSTQSCRADSFIHR